MPRVLYSLIFLVLISCSKKTTKYDSTLKNKAIEISKSYLGIPYSYGGISPKGLDCSGLVYLTFQKLGKNLPRTADAQALVFNEIPKKNLMIGDLVYFKVASSKKIDHTGIVLEIKNADEILFIHSSSSKGVRIDNLFSKYWFHKFVKATRPNY